MSTKKPITQVVSQALSDIQARQFALSETAKQALADTQKAIEDKQQTPLNYDDR